MTDIDVTQDTAAYLSTASEIIGALGAAFYFAPETVEVGRQHGIDGFRFYFLGRGGVLGDVGPKVIESAFGYWHPELVAKIWTSACERADVTPREAGRLYWECSADLGRREFANLPGLDAFCAAGEKVLAAVNPAGLALFAGTVGEPLADDLPGRAMQITTVLREFRGSAHLVAVLAVGLEPKVAHGVRRPDFWGSFGYDEAHRPQSTPQIAALMAESDALTDRLVGPAYSVLDAVERKALLDGLVAMRDAHAAAAPESKGGS